MAPLIHGRLKDGNDGILVVGHNEDTAELVKQSLELRASHVLVVHDFLQVVMPPEIMQQSGSTSFSKKLELHSVVSSKK